MCIYMCVCVCVKVVLIPGFTPASVCCTISANFYIYLLYFQQKIFNFSKISASQIDPSSTVSFDPSPFVSWVFFKDLDYCFTHKIFLSLFFSFFLFKWLKLKVIFFSTLNLNR